MLWPNQQVTTLRFQYRNSSIRIVSSESDSLWGDRVWLYLENERSASALVVKFCAWKCWNLSFCARRTTLRLRDISARNSAPIVWTSHFTDMTWAISPLPVWTTLSSVTIFSPSNPGRPVPCTSDNVGTIVLAIVVKYDCNKRNFIARSLFCYV